MKIKIDRKSGKDRTFVFANISDSIGYNFLINFSTYYWEFRNYDKAQLFTYDEALEVLNHFIEIRRSKSKYEVININDIKQNYEKYIKKSI